LDAIVVTTGSGFEYDDIDPYLTGAIVDTEKPLPPNPEGAAKLKATLAALTQASETKPAEPLPEIAQEISNKTYLFEPNASGVDYFRVDFSDPDKAVIYITLFDGLQELAWEIGLDGVYRRLPDGSMRRGGWTDPQTFVFEVVDADTQTYTVTFEGDRMVLESPGEGLRFEGKQESP
jgi:hypothetical protein